MTPRKEGLVQANGMELAYEEFGAADGVPLILIMGLGAQLVFWPDALVERLVDQGFRVIRFDNRDIGLSTKLHGQRVPKLPWLILGALVGLPRRVPYLLTDMARDTVGLMDALGIARAHVVGASMGGMIAQLVAIHFPERVLTLTSIMSTTGSRLLPRPDPKLLALLTAERPPSEDRAALIEAGVQLVKAIGTPDNGASDDERRTLVTRAIDRGYYPEGPQRQLAAIISSGSRRKALKRVTVPTLVLHGTADRLVPPAGGRDTAKRVPGARLVWLEGMGHDLPGSYHSRIAQLITEHARRV